MYKLLLCLQYLRTRYLALLCVVSVLLGVAILIVVNSVMSGFSSKLKDRLRGMTSDVTIATARTDGFERSPAELEKALAESPVGGDVKAVSPTIETFALLQFSVNGRIPFTKQVRLVGIDPARHARVGGFGGYLRNTADDPARCFDLGPAARRRYDDHRLQEYVQDARDRAWDRALAPTPAPPANPLGFLPQPPTDTDRRPDPLPPPDLGAAAKADEHLPGIVLGYSIAHTQMTDPDTGKLEDAPLLLPGDDVYVATVGATGLKPVAARFVVTDYFKSDMSEYDGNVVYVALPDLQRLRGMDDRVNCLQVRLTDAAAHNSKYMNGTFVPEANRLVRPEGFADSWEQQQSTLLSAIDIERGLLNLLLFMIVGVAGFGVLAIFGMIVSEKYRDIGILKSLGASSGGVLAIFVGYALLLGAVGCVLGTILGLTFTHYINEIEQALAYLTGQQIFDRKVYYFDKIPTNVEPLAVVLVNLGAAAIAVVSSIAPAVRAARLQPVRALRFE